MNRYGPFMDIQAKSFKPKSILLQRPNVSCKLVQVIRMRKIWGSLLLIEEDASLVAPEHSFQNSVTFFLGQLFDCTKANFVPLATRQPT